MASSSDQEDDCCFFSGDDDDEIYGGCGLSYADDSDGDDRYSYTVLKESDIRRKQNDDIARVSAVYSVSRSHSTTLLLHFNWSVNKLNDAWVVDEQAVRRSAGLFDNPQTVGFPDLCEICFESHRIGKIHAAACGHPYCADCWIGYIGSAINDGPRCLTLRCPDPSCDASVGEEMILKLTPIEDDKNKYFRYLIRSYVEDQKRTKWCPAPNCEFAVNLVSGSGGFDVNCLCSNRFCWNCSEGAHQPVDCNTVKSWIIKNSAESENVTYILAYTKPCPKCNRPIEKNEGCNHMTCNSACRHQFCWTCLADWKGHKNCNGFKSKTGETEDKKKRRIAKISLQRYTHYYERWANNHKSMNKAMEDLKTFKEQHVEKIKNTQFLDGCNKENIAEFIIEAWQQIIECRRVLKWTYAYGYYIPEKETAKRDLFEYLQGEAEKGLERLHAYSENELKPYIEATGQSEDFQTFRRDLVSLTKVTKTYFENLVKALQNGLADIEPGTASEGRKRLAGVEAGRARKVRRNMPRRALLVNR